MSVVNKFNRGEVSPLALARDDVKKVIDSCELMDNFLPLRLGPMTYRPGIEYIGDAYSPTTTRNRALIPLTRSIGDTVIFEFAGTTMRPLVDGLPIACSSATSGFTDGDFNALTGWTTTAGITTGTVGSDTCVRLDSGDWVYQTSGTVTAGVIQTFKVVVYYAPVLFKVADGASSTFESDILDVVLHPGTQYIQFTPVSTSFTISILNAEKLFGDGIPTAFVGYCDNVTSGNIQFDVDDIDYQALSCESSADVLYMACGEDVAPKILRRIGTGSATKNGYTFEDYFNVGGPFQAINPSDTTLISGNDIGFCNVTTATSTFYDKHLGKLLRLIYPEVKRTKSFTSTGADYYVGVRGDGSDREMLIQLSGFGSATLALERYDPIAAAWDTVRTYTANTTDIIVDKFDGELRLYRFNCTAHTSGTIVASIEYISLSAGGHGKIVAISTDKVITVNAINSFIYDTTNPPVQSSLYWYFGAWGPGEYPQGVTIYEGRVVWVSKNRVDMTVTDDYWNFDTTIAGSSAAITRTIGFGPVDDISWVESTTGLFLGLPTTEVLVRSSNYDEPLTPLNTNLKPIKGSVGAKAVRPALSDDAIYFVSRDGKRVHKLTYEIAQTPTVLDQMMMHPTICDDGIAAIVGTQHPEHRLWVLTETGELRVLLKEPTEDVQAWARVTTEGVIEDLCVVPAIGEDELWMLVTRNGQTNVEKMAAFSAIEPMDSFIRYTSPGTATLTGLDHLEGLDVGIWADGQHRGTATVASGTVTVDSAAYTTVIVGLEYSADYKSNKLGQYVDSSVIGERKTVSGTALVMRNYSPGAVQVGRDFNNLLDLPGNQTGAIVTDYDEQAFGFNGTSNTDSRICLRANKPCTIMALRFNIAEKPRQTNG